MKKTINQNQEFATIKWLATVFSLLLLLSLTNLSAQTKGATSRKIVGTVLDEANVPIPGVSVLVKNTTKATTTDFDGKYEITVPTNVSILQFSSIGFLKQEKDISGKSVVNVTLTLETKSLSEVVVVGYGKQKKETLTGAVSNITTAAIQTTTSASMAQKLQGKVAGLNIRQNSGQPGVFDNSINIRGFGSPMYIIDGVRRGDGSEFQRLNANDIESISVLKDASAAIYGLGAANGVILVTTKKGKKGKPVFEYSSVTGFISPTDIPRMANAGQYAELFNDTQINRVIGGVPFYTQEQIDKYVNEVPGFESTDWYDVAIKKTAMQTQHNLSASGASDDVSYFIGLGYVNEEGLLKSNDMGYQRYNLRSNLTAKLTKNVEAQLLIGGRYDNRTQPGDSFFNIFKGTRSSVPTDRPYANNNPLYPSIVLPGNQNPMVLADRDITGYVDEVTRNLQTSLSLDYHFPFLKGMSLKGMASYDANNFESNNLSKSYTLYSYDQVLGIYKPVIMRNGTGNISYRTTNSNSLSLQGFLTYKPDLGENHNLSAVGVIESNQGNGQFVSIKKLYATVYTKDEIRYGDALNQETDGLRSESADLSYLGRVNYDFKGKYLLELAGRYMGSYRYSPENRWGFYPMGSVGWIVSKENFLKNNVSVMSNLKLRASYGTTAQPAGNAFQYIDGYTIGSGGSWEFSNDLITNGVSTPVPANPNLTWQTATTTDFGIDLGFWQNKFTFTADVFDRLVEGIPANLSVGLPNTYGGTLPQENLNSNRTQGFEFEIGYKNHGRAFKYDVSGNFTYSRTKNLHREGEAFNNSMQRYTNQKGYRWNDLQWAYTYDGYYQNEQEILNGALQNGATGNINRELPGDFKYEDINNDGIIDGQDQKPLFYNSAPKMFFGMTMNAAFKGFDINVLFQGAAQYTVRYTGVYGQVMAFNGNLPDYFYDRWHKADQFDPTSEWIPGKWPATRLIADVGGMYKESSVWRKDASYVRLKNIEIGYTFEGDQPFMKQIGIKSLRFYASGFNLYTFCDPFVKAFDPEKTVTTDDGDQEGEGFTYPLTTTYNFGLNISF
ncbi:SusC/RagA family TonB-linked outer membrane protein [Flavobacterium nackdongense]|uniref:TonB-dependent receptor n=1 Tax=Flavobacterium nackdongense TaxID=2547394 RepID=A0A4P6YAW5_9FLAO|nr:TonB-dependent receptor [Flavobacterium nackdongense]QBN17420.1 TonB-dependent receptor [Flavobacterium nackdongense]